MSHKHITAAGLYRKFFIISAFTFGGGYAMLPMVEKELSEKNAHLTDQQILDDYALAQSFPGVIGINASALMGFRLRGRWGALAAVLGFVTPSVIIISLIAAFLGEIQDIVFVQKAFTGLRAGVVALMLNSLIKIVQGSLKSVFSYIIFACAAVIIFLSVIHPVWVILSGGLCGLLLAGRFERIRS